MLLNSHDRINTLFEIRNHARAAYQSIQRENWTDLCNVIQTSWKLNQALDQGTNTPEVAAIVESIGDLTASVKLLGAGGGGYMLILAKDENAGHRIRSKLTATPPNPRARFVDFSISPSGLQITRS
jgi:galactokinase/mevalonate kinase-like predicted kinase